MDNIEGGLTATETFTQSDSSSPSQFHSTVIPVRELASVYFDSERTITGLSRPIKCLDERLRPFRGRITARASIFLLFYKSGITQKCQSVAHSAVAY